MGKCIGDKMIYLVSFRYDYSCQGTESAYTKVLVRNAGSFVHACILIKMTGTWDNPREFEDLTV